MNEPERREWRAFWNISFDVFNGTPRTILEITLWDVDNVQRLGRRTVPLAHVVEGTVSFTGDVAEFDDGCLLYDLDLNQEVEALLSAAGLPPILELELKGTSISIQGRNVSIEADIALDANAVAAGVQRFPIFHYPQPGSNGVRLFENSSNMPKRSIDWRLSGGQANSATDFELESDDAYHRIQVAQDLTGGTAVFEYTVDGIPVGLVTTAANHDFDGALQTFFIGGVPDPANPGNNLRFHGTIGHLEFDPNNSCKNCPTAGGEPQGEMAQDDVE
ncbi:MAG TPA: hypothetical protein VF434_10195 [Promineifilum sp.]